MGRATREVHMAVTARLGEDGTLLDVVLDAPKGNVLDIAHMGRLSAVLGEHRERQALRLVLLRSAGPDFSFGASIPEHRRGLVPALLTTFHGLVRDVAAYPVPVAAAVQGRCLGGAFELALACHFVLAAPGATFACPEIKLGVFPPVLAAIGALRLPGALAERMLLTGASVGAEAARHAGFVAAILEGDLAEAAAAWHRVHLRPLSAFALRQATQVSRTALRAALEGGLERAERHYLDSLLAGHDPHEGVEAFLGRRPAAWRDA